MANSRVSLKRLQVDKANATMVTIIAVAAFVVTFSLVASRALLSTRAYQSRVISAKAKADTQLKANLQAADKLVNAYTAFVSTPDNIIGGSSTGSGDRDGDNGKIILDALPSKYDFPGLTSSLEKLLTSNTLTITSIGGTDDEVAQAPTQASANPDPVQVPFNANVLGNYTSIKVLIGEYERSIRPMYVKTLDLSGTNAELQADITAITYYQPEKSLTFTTESIR